jgi:hypothetical protein
MARKRHTAEEIVAKLRQVDDVLMARNPHGRCFSGWSVLPQPGGRATATHRRNNLVCQILHEHAATLSTAPI